jgi:hypothetical protein
MPNDKVHLQDFLALSAVVTGFSSFRLLGTGQADTYLSTVIDVVGDSTVSDLLARFRLAREEAAGDEATLDRLLRAHVFSDEKVGPIARNVITLWDVGTWYQLPAAWRDAYGARERDVTFVVSAAAYTESLLWPAVGANPPGAKGQGYATWADPPRIPEIQSSNGKRQRDIKQSERTAR